MLKFSGITVFALVLLAVSMPGKPNQTSNKDKQGTSQKNETSTALKHNERTEEHPDKTNSNPPDRYAAIKRPEWWLVVAAFLTLVFVAWQAYETRRAVKGAAESVGAINGQTTIMQGQLDTMKGQLELEHRPWIAVSIEPSSPLVFDERGCVLTCKVTMINVGHSAAKHVSLWTDFALSGTENPIEIRDRLCNIMKSPQNKGSDYGWLLFPNQSAVEGRPIIAVPERIKKALENKTFQGINAIGLHLVGCVDYPSPIDDKKRHQTRFEYLVSFVDIPTGRTMGAFDPSKKIYQPIALMPTMHGTSAD